MFDEFLTRAAALRSEDIPFAIAIVVRYEPPVSGKPGDKAIVEADGSIWGWIGGGCVQPLVVRQALVALQDGRPRLVRIASGRDVEVLEGTINYPMTCHGDGALDIYIEPVLPKPQILILGRSSVAQALCNLGKTVGYRIIVAAAGANPERFPFADVTIDRLDLRPVRITPETYIVISCQGEQDNEALELAAGTDAPYIAFVASEKKARKVLDSLAENGVDRDRLARIRAPAGLHLGALSPEEIALSILAEIVQVRKKPMAKLQIKGSADAVLGREVKDPVCGMVVAERDAIYFSDYAGGTYYFCCSGCKRAFDKEPEIYLKSVVTKE